MDRGIEIRSWFGNKFKASIVFKYSDIICGICIIENVGNDFLKAKNKDNIDLLIAIDNIATIEKVE